VKSLTTSQWHTLGAKVQLHSVLTLAVDSSGQLQAPAALFPLGTEQEAKWNPQLV
jgi:hypothetical protein